MRACGISLFKMPPGLVAIFASAWARIKSPAGSAMPRSTASPPWKNWRTVRRLSVVGSLLSSSIFTLGSSLVSVVHCTALRGRWRGQMAVQISRVGQRAFHREDVIVLAPFYVFPPTPVIKFGSEEMKRRELQLLCSGESILSFGVTEPNAGTDTSRIQNKKNQLHVVAFW